MFCHISISEHTRAQDEYEDLTLHIAQKVNLLQESFTLWLYEFFCIWKSEALPRFREIPQLLNYEDYADRTLLNKARGM